MIISIRCPHSNSCVGHEVEVEYDPAHPEDARQA